MFLFSIAVWVSLHQQDEITSNSNAINNTLIVLFTLLPHFIDRWSYAALSSMYLLVLLQLSLETRVVTKGVTVR